MQGTSPSTTTTTMTSTEGALHLWREIVRGLQSAGYARVVPEYLKLSRALSQARMTELLQGEPEAQHWTELRKLALEALQSLDPLVEAARVLAELPYDLRDTAEIAPEATVPTLPSVDAAKLPEATPSVTVEPVEPVKALPRQRSTKARRHADASSNGASARKKKSVAAKSKSSASRGRVKSRD